MPMGRSYTFRAKLCREGPSMSVRLAVVPVAVATIVAASAAREVRTAALVAAPAVYDHIKSFALTGESAEVTSLALVRDRVEMTFTGTFYFTAPVEGKI